MTNLDVICIGAINYDYMFHCKEEDLNVKEELEGDEKLSNPISEIENDVQELVKKDRAYTTQVGGSAFITLKVVKYILEDLKVAYVGVCGTPTEFDIRYGKTNDMEKELAHLDNREWLFRTNDLTGDPYHKAIARSIVRLYNHNRYGIKIAPCANNLLLGQIEAKEKNTGESFAEYLSHAKWIHVSSLSDFAQFESIMGYVIEAKKINPELKVSMDPGFEYTSKWKDRLQKLVCHVDYVFLNNSEKNNLGSYEKNEEQLYQNLREYFKQEDGSIESCLIVKYIDHHDILHFTENDIDILTLPHQKLDISELNNDTGAGDSFVGGFVAGMMSESMNSDIANPIKLGVLAAKGRMTSYDHEDPYEKIQQLAKAFIKER